MTDRPDSVQPLWTFLVVFHAIASPLTVITNALVIWAVLGDEDIRSSVFNLLLAALALTDFFVGLIVEPLFLLHLVRLLQDSHSPCFFTSYIFSALVWCAITLVTFAIASVERYFAIEHPLAKINNSSKRVVLVTLGVLWVVTPAVIISSSILLRLYNPGLLKLPFMVFMVVCGLIIFYCTSKVFVTAYRQSRAIAMIAVQLSTVQPQLSPNGQLKEYKRVFMLTILLVASFVFYCPSIINISIEVSQGKNAVDFFRYTSTAISGTFVSIQSLVNPVIMSLRLSYIRQRIKNKLFSFIPFIFKL